MLALSSGRAPRDWHRLEEGEVHVWAVDLERAGRCRGDVLSMDERERVARLGVEVRRLEFARSRAVLRHILAGYTGIPAGRLELGAGRYGKPRLSSPTVRGAPPPCFNLSHCYPRALVAVSASSEVGVDVERLRVDLAPESLAERFFTDDERRALRRVSPARRAAAFLGCWTRKEAYLKARGTGMGRPLDGFAVSVPPTAPRLEWDAADAGAPDRFHLADLSPGPGEIAALAVHMRPGAPGPRVSLREWRP